MHSVFIALSLGLVAACFPDLPDTEAGDSNPPSPDGLGEDASDATTEDVEEADTQPADGTDAKDVTSEPDSEVAAPPSVPALSVSSDRADGVLVTWTPAPTAQMYRIHRGGQVIERLAEEGTAWLDRTPAAPGAYGPPERLSASSDRESSVMLTWAPPIRPLGAQVEYRIEAINESGSSGLSEVVNGARAAPLITDWEVQIEGRAWVSRGDDAPNFEDVNAPPPEVVVEGPSATKGEHKGMVRLAAVSVLATPTPVSYRVRGVLEDGTRTPESDAASGFRASSTVAWSWARASAPAGAEWTHVGDASSGTLDDIGAPVDGSSRFYRVEARAGDELVGSSGVVEGWRLAFRDVSGGQYHFCGLTTRDRVWCWGENSAGQLGRGTTSPELEPFEAAPIEGLAGVLGLASGRKFNIAWFANGDALAWGFGTFGDGAAARTSARPIAFGFPSISNAAPGVFVACLTDTSRRLFCWGNPGLVGDGTFEARAVPTRVRLSSGWNLEDVSSVSRPHEHTCAATIGGTVHCWGLATDGRTGSTIATQSGYHLSAQPAVAGIDDARTVAVSYGASCAVQGNGLVRCWGSADHGAPSTGVTPTQIDGLNNVTTVVATFSTFCALRENGSIWCWGSNSEGGLGRDSDVRYSETAAPVVGISGARALAASAFTSQSFCAVLEDFSVACWGSNNGGQLGDGSTELRRRPVPVQFP